MRLLKISALIRDTPWPCPAPIDNYLARITLKYGSAVLLLITTPSRSQTQEVQVLSSTKQCLSCEFALVHVAAIDVPDAHVSLTREGMIVRLSHNEYLVSTGRENAPLLLADSAGRIVAPLWRSEIPKSNPLLRLFPTAANNVVVVDLARGTQALIDTTLHVHERGKLQLAIQQMLFLNEDRAVAVAEIPTPDKIGLPFHLLDRTGKILRSFGLDSDSAFSAPAEHGWVLAAGGSQQFWAARVNRYELQLWNAQGRHLRTLERICSCFAPWDRSSYPPDYFRPESRLVAMQTDGLGRLWVVLRVPDKHWRRTRRVLPSGEVPPIPLGEERRVYDSLIEVIDPGTLRVLANKRFDMPLRGFAGTNLLYALGTDEHGRIRIDVWRGRFEER